VYPLVAIAEGEPLAVRIYTLAKELNLDNKVLLEMCSKAGVSGKGSALASLTDEEVDKLRAFATNRTASPAPARPAPSRPVPVRPIAAVPTVPTVPTVATTSAKAASGKSGTATLTPPGTMRREDYLPPGGVVGRPPILTDKGAGEPRKKPPAGDASRPPSKAPPSIKLAPMPTAQQPTEPVPPAEPAPQKPDIKLPIDAIRASKAGAKPLSEHIRKHDEKRKAEAAKTSKPGPRPAAGRAAPPPAEAPLGMPGRDRARKGSRGVAKDAEGPVAMPGRELRQLNRKRTGGGRKRGRDEDDGGRRDRRQLRRTGRDTALPRKSNAVVELPCTVRSFSEAIGLPASRVLGKLLALNAPLVNINATLEAEMAEMLAVELGVEVDFKRPADLETEMLASAARPDEEDEASLRPRAPVVTFLGHVDHGKTSLLDRIIGIDVVSGESGGITQHIRAYRVERNGQPIAFVDTPGHEAFTQMRARGAQVTDIAVLVVAADDGVMPQTEEAISHARAAGVPIVVALNKIDLPGVNTQRIYEQLAANELLPVEWGGETEVVKCSAIKGEGIDKLLETLQLTAELHDYKTNVDVPAYGTCLEAELHEGRGVMAKFLVQRGTLRVGDVIVCGSAHGRVKAMYDTLNPRITYDEAGPSTPVNITGLSEAPGAGDHFYALADIVSARQIAEKRAQHTRTATLSGHAVHVSLENLFDRLSDSGDNQVRMLNLILRADVRGSIEAIRKELQKLDHPEVQIKILQATVGGITEADVHLADASDAIIIGFNVVPDEKARALGDSLGVQIRRYDIIYQVSQDLKLALEGMLRPEKREMELGRALVLRTFVISRMGTVAGCRVLSGTIERNAKVRVIRENRIIGTYPLESLRREKDDAREVREGFECGMKLAGFNDLKEGDVLEAYRIEEIARTI
jgi:translation initiation factor IF-2